MKGFKMKEWVKKRDPIVSRYPWKWLLSLRHAPNKETSYGKCQSQAYLIESLSLKAQWNLSLLTSLITEENLKGELKRNSGKTGGDELDYAPGLLFV